MKHRKNKEPLSLPEHIKLSTVNTFQQLYATVAPWVLGGVVIVGAGSVIWYAPTIVLKLAWWCVIAAVGHVVFYMLYWKCYENPHTEEAPLFKICGHELVVRESGNAEPGIETNIAAYISSLIAQMIAYLRQGTPEGEQRDELGQTPVTAYLTKAASMTPIVKKVRFSQPRNQRKEEKRPRYSIPSSYNFIHAIPDSRLPSTSATISLPQLGAGVGLLFSSIGTSSEEPSQSLSARVLILRIQIGQAKLGELDEVTSSLHSLLLDLTPEKQDRDRINAATFANAQALQSLASRCSHILYTKRDQALKDAWWHDAVLPAHLSSIDITELTDWIKLCLHGLATKKSQIQSRVDTLSAELMQMRLKGKMEKLPRGKKERAEEAKRPKVKMEREEREACEVGVRIKGKARESAAYSGMAGDLVGWREHGTMRVGHGFLERSWCADW